MKKQILSPFDIPTQPFKYIPEWCEFLALFPHRGSFLWAHHPKDGEKPEWHTESKHLLSDRLIQQGAYLYGVRFGANTNYLMLDIDQNSRYHPYRDPLAINRILEALEPLGLYSFCGVTSSYSGGLHIYFPFALAVPSWKIAHAAQALLESKGFKCDRGQLELFPNARRCDGADYNGHRLPLQGVGSYLVNESFNTVYGGKEEFVQRWRFASSRNDSPTEKQLDQILKSYKRSAPRKLSVDAKKFLDDLNADIEPGWSGYGQTNFIVCRVAMREYIFGHILTGRSEPLTGLDLEFRILQVVTSLPNYKEFCRHQHEIHVLATYAARSVELSEYYPYKGSTDKLEQEKQHYQNQWNLLQADRAKERIKKAVADLLASNAALMTVTDWVTALIDRLKCSASTLYKYRELWHPRSLDASNSACLHPDQRESAGTETLEAIQEGTLHPTQPNKLSSLPEGAPQEQPSEGTTDQAVGGSKGGSPQGELTRKTAEGISLVNKILQRLRGEKQEQERSNTDPPPDENYFRQLGIWGST